MFKIKKDVNVYLLFLILAVSITFVVLGVSYNLKFKALSSDYRQKLDELSEINEKLLLEKKISEKYSKLEELTEKDMEALERSCFTLKEEIDNLKEQKKSLQDKLSFSSVQKSVCETTGNAKCLE